MLIHPALWCWDILYEVGLSAFLCFLQLFDVEISCFLMLIYPARWCWYVCFLKLIYPAFWGWSVPLLGGDLSYFLMFICPTLYPWSVLLFDVDPPCSLMWSILLLGGDLSCFLMSIYLLFDGDVPYVLMFIYPGRWCWTQVSRCVHWGRYIEQHRPESSTITISRHARKYKAHKFHWGLSNAFVV